MDDTAAASCQQAIARVAQVDEDELVDAHNGDLDYEAGVMFTRAVPEAPRTT